VYTPSLSSSWIPMISSSKLILFKLSKTIIRVNFKQIGGPDVRILTL
jgi:hypothetical protein